MEGRTILIMNGTVKSATVKNNRNYFFDENGWLVAIKFAAVQTPILVMMI